MGNDLTSKQKIFCEEYVIDWNATRAALAAGYSKKTAYSIGNENLKKPEIASYINEIQRDLSKLAGISALKNVLELKKIAYSNIGNLREDWYTVREFDQLTEDEKAAISKVVTDERTDKQGRKVTYVKLETHDKMRAIEILNKMLGYNAPDKQEVRQYSEGLTPDQENDRIEQLLERRAKRSSGS